MTEELKDWLLYPQDMVLEPELIFIDHEMRHTRICVMPSENVRSEKENVSYLLEKNKNLTDERGRAYLDAFIRIYMKRPGSTNYFLSVLEDMKKEAGTG